MAELALTKQEILDLSQKGDGLYARETEFVLSEVHTKNLLSVRFSSGADDLLIASGGADGRVLVTNVESEERVATFENVGPSLSLDFHPLKQHLLLQSSMDRSHRILNLRTQEVQQTFSDHTKYVSKARWHPGGKLFATASYDHDVCFYKLTDPETDRYELLHRVNFLTSVESILFMQWEGASVLLVAVSEDNLLYTIDLKTWQKQQWNMNANGDDIVSFSVLDTAASHDGRYILVSTDQCRVIQFQVHPFKQVRNYYGIPSNDMGQTRCCFDPSDKYVYATAHDKAVHVFEVATEKLIEKLEGHTAIARDIHHHPSRKLLASGSFDKSIRIWKYAPNPKLTTPPPAEL